MPAPQTSAGNARQAQQLAAMRDDADAMLEIIGMASVDDVYTFDTVQL